MIAAGTMEEMLACDHPWLRPISTACAARASPERAASSASDEAERRYASDETEKGETMETRANYALIGAFTLAVVFAAFGFVFWFSGPSQTAQYKTYRDHLHRLGVAACSRGGAVRLQRPEGRRGDAARHFRRGPEPRRRARQHRPKTPIKTNTRARLEQTGFTGVAGVSLSAARPRAEDLAPSRARPIRSSRRSAPNLQNIWRTCSSSVDERDRRARQGRQAARRQFRRPSRRR